MKRRHAIPLPRKRVREKGRAGVDRPPLRFYRTAARYCPRHAIWVGPGSAFANPFAPAPDDAPPGAPLRKAVDAAARRVRGPKREIFWMGTLQPPPVTEQERAMARAWLYREWRVGRLGDLSRDVTFWLEQVDALPTPPTDADIQRELVGRDLVDATPDRWPSHADELLTIANAPMPQA